MNRLPCCDRATRRSEVVVFLSLGLAGMMMVALTAVQMTKFVAGSDRITAALAGRQAPPSARTLAESDRRPITNSETSLAALNGVADHEAGRLAVTALRLVWR